MWPQCLETVSLSRQVGIWGWGSRNFQQVGADGKEGDLGWPHLCSHKASTTGRVQDQGSMVWTLKGLREAVNCEAGSTVLQGSHILGTGC